MERSYRLTNPGVNHQHDDWALLIWDDMTGTDVGGQAEFVTLGDRSVQVEGSFAQQDTQLWLEGSNDGVSWHVLRNPFNEPLAFSAPGLHTVLDVCQWVRPRVVNGGASQLSVKLLLRF